VIVCDNDGQLERLEELIGSDRATLAVGALDGGFIMPTLRVLTDHEIFRRHDGCGARVAIAAPSRPLPRGH